MFFSALSSYFVYTFSDLSSISFQDVNKVEAPKIVNAAITIETTRMINVKRSCVFKGTDWLRTSSTITTAIDPMIPPMRAERIICLFTVHLLTIIIVYVNRNLHALLYRYGTGFAILF